VDIYRPRRPTDCTLHRVLTEHVETFLDDAAMSRPDSLPRFVATELREYLRCGVLSEGFARMHCDACGHDRLVGLSCKGRGFCPSCGGRRMTELAAHLVDHVLPVARTRQWVLSLPFALRASVAWDHDLALAVQRVVVRAVLGAYRRRAQKAGIADGRAGAISVIQRFGSALNLNPHFHLLVPDGVFAQAASGSLRFHPTQRFSRTDIERIAKTIRIRVTRLVERRVSHDDDVSDPLATCYAASLANSAAREPAAHHRALTLSTFHTERMLSMKKPLGLRARDEGFDLHAGVVVPKKQRKLLEHLCRYLTRPALSHDRITLTENSRVRIQLKTPWQDGTTHLTLDPLAFCARLSALIPRPRKNLLVYHGVLAPNARLRPRIVTLGRTTNSEPALIKTKRPHRAWADLMRRTFAIDVTTCPKCGGRLRLMAILLNPRAAVAILRSLGLPHERITLAPSRGPPDEHMFDEQDFQVA